MKKINLNEAADEFEMINAETHVFYNVKTGEFDFYGDFMDNEDADVEKFENDEWIAAPSQRNINEYDIMTEFIDTVNDPHKNELLSVALEGKGAFKRFKDTLNRVGLTNEWFKYKREAYIEIVREWCDENDLEYEKDDKMHKPQLASSSEDDISSESITILPLSLAKTKKQAADILREAFSWCYNGDAADEEIKNLLNPEHIALVAIYGSRVVGIIGAVPQYGVTGWELHPLAVLEEYRGYGFGTALVEALEREVAKRGGVTLYLGSDDEFGTTSLSDENLYDDTFDKIANIKNTNGHPFTFYEKLGYKIVGVIPDANGVGKPDILMAKRIKSKWNI